MPDPLDLGLIGLEALADALRDRLRRPLPGHEAHGTMAPFPARAARETLSTETNEGRPAATLVLLYPGPSGAAHLVLTVRQPSLRAHSGQVALPGGALDADETPEDAARREAWEEVGVDPAAVDVLGRLTPLYIPPSAFSVWPVVAAVGDRPAFTPQEAEVAELLEVPVARLLEADVRQTTPMDLRGAAFDVPYWDLGGRVVWGATAMMLAEFEAVLRDAAGGLEARDLAGTGPAGRPAG